MPSITDLKNIKKTNKLFQKKEYRPWSHENKNETSITKTIEKSQKKISLQSNFTDTDLEKIWRRLYGAKKTLLEIILNNIEEKHDHFVITKAIMVSQLVTNSSLPTNTIKTSLQQLKQDMLILNYERKPGKGGFARYKIPKNIYNYFINKFSSSN